MGIVAGDADHREVPRREDQRADGARIVDTLAAVAFARELIDIDSTTGIEQAAGEWLVRELERRGYRVERPPRARGPAPGRPPPAASTCSRATQRRSSCCPRTSTACRRSSPRRSATENC